MCRHGLEKNAQILVRQVESEGGMSSAASITKQNKAHAESAQTSFNVSTTTSHLSFGPTMSQHGRLTPRREAEACVVS